ncbi:MAG: DUF4154 domain-containing protein [Myxococcales bacterium]|nr:DUF4154 domain-containing protein [Myxococcales bacterium]
MLLALLSLPAFGQDAPDPKIAMPILLKVLTYDVNFEARGRGEFVVLVASENGQQAEREKLLGVLTGLSVATIKNRPLKFVGTEFRDEGSLQSEIDRHKASAVLAVPGLSEKALNAVSEVSQDNQIYTLSLDRSMVEKALAVGVTQAGGRPQILINEKASRAVGAKFESAVLKLAKVIQ